MKFDLNSVNTYSNTILGLKVAACVIQDRSFLCTAGINQHHSRCFFRLFQSDGVSMCFPNNLQNICKDTKQCTHVSSILLNYFAMHPVSESFVSPMLVQGLRKRSEGGPASVHLETALHGSSQTNILQHFLLFVINRVTENASMLSVQQT